MLHGLGIIGIIHQVESHLRCGDAEVGFTFIAIEILVLVRGFHFALKRISRCALRHDIDGCTTHMISGRGTVHHFHLCHSVHPAYCAGVFNCSDVIVVGLPSMMTATLDEPANASVPFLSDIPGRRQKSLVHIVHRLLLGEHGGRSSAFRSPLSPAGECLSPPLLKRCLLIYLHHGKAVTICGQGLTCR